MDLDPVSPFAGIQRAEGLWWEDCGLVIQAENTVYRVSRDFLAGQSPVFRDMLLLPIPSDAETLEGCPLVRIPDTAEDMTYFFKALFFYDFFQAHPHPTTFRVVSSVLRMSDKYGVDGLRARALGHLSLAHPMTLEELKALPTADDNTLIDSLYDAGADVVALARRLSLDWLLPFAFYRLCQSHIHDLIFTADLSVEDKQRWLNGHRLLEGRENNALLDFFWTPESIDGCVGDACDLERLSFRKVTLGWGTLTTLDLLPNLPLDIWDDKDWERLDVCDTCLSVMKAHFGAAKDAFWERLPKIFDLPSWMLLKKMKDDALN
ncbi:BTB domain-containing protein [Mycena indigotica]|uniref:BTB domain-containing protein n=1 Tax=Mycena indigotica TaxID=2126181 RepID=A0A8H6SK47_9AGAR|nr:BTB domain-containing protein [Mycena indigotica]KAF7299305.1 BTB domain-containing protein [Mycena indigotica]